MAEDPLKAVLHYAQALKAPRIRDSAARLAEQARDAGWTHEEYLAAVLSREVAAREASGAAIRIRSAGFPTRKSLEDFNFDHQPALNRDMIAHLGTGVVLAKASNVVLLGPLPTPGVAMLTRSLRADLGVMISASHNAYQDNGIKLFGPDGYKLSDADELAIEVPRARGRSAEAEAVVRDDGASGARGERRATRRANGGRRARQLGLAGLGAHPDPGPGGAYPGGCRRLGGGGIRALRGSAPDRAHR